MSIKWIKLARTLFPVEITNDMKIKKPPQSYRALWMNLGRNIIYECLSVSEN